ncbi:MAG: hypothetical protein ACLQPV_01150 [Vulcanimicrobiaceae bacterium]
MATTRFALADQHYDVSGDDEYYLGSAKTPSLVVYTGDELLTVAHDGPKTRFSAAARCTRSDGRTRADMRPSFVQDLDSAGAFEDVKDDDPDFLTILNQPFSIELDDGTLRDLRVLRGAVPFNVASPIDGEQLTGSMSRGQDGKIEGSDVLGVLFTANGPVTATLPEPSAAAVTGTIRLDGSAYYALTGALLLGSEITLTISGTLRDPQTNAPVPVRIVYHRMIRADKNAPATQSAYHH